MAEGLGVLFCGDAVRKLKHLAVSSECDCTADKLCGGCFAEQTLREIDAMAENRLETCEGLTHQGE